MRWRTIQRRSFFLQSSLSLFLSPPAKPVVVDTNQKAVLSKIMERTAKNQVIFRAGTKKKKSRNPHGYWIFRWRSGWDSNPRAREDYLISSAAPSTTRTTLHMSIRKSFPKLLERTDGKNCEIFGFSNCGSPQKHWILGGQN